MPSLRQLAVMADRLQRQATELQTQLAALIESEARPQPTPRNLPHRAAKWSGPVPEQIRRSRRRIHVRRFNLCTELGLVPTFKQFAIKHNLSMDAPSRWLTDKARGVQPGGALDQTLWRCHREDIREYTAMKRAKRHGAVEKSNIALPFPHKMTA
jgi:hypothetical protein